MCSRVHLCEGGGAMMVMVVMETITHIFKMHAHVLKQIHNIHIHILIYVLTHSLTHSLAHSLTH